MTRHSDSASGKGAGAGGPGTLFAHPSVNNVSLNTAVISNVSSHTAVRCSLSSHTAVGSCSTVIMVTDVVSMHAVWAPLCQQRKFTHTQLSSAKQVHTQLSSAM